MAAFKISIDTKKTIWRRDTYEAEAPSKEFLEGIVQSNLLKLPILLDSEEEIKIGKVKFKLEDSDVILDTETSCEDDEGNVIIEVSFNEGEEFIAGTTEELKTVLEQFEK